MVKRLKIETWADVPDSEFEEMDNFALAVRYGKTENAAKAERNRRRKAGRLDGVKTAAKPVAETKKSGKQSALTLNIKPETKERLTAEAKRQGCDLKEYAECALNEYMELPDVNIPKKPDPKEEREQLSEMLTILTIEMLRAVKTAFKKIEMLDITEGAGER